MPVGGCQRPGSVPLGKKKPKNRLGVSAADACIGIIASSIGKDNATPAPLKSVRLERGCFFITIIMFSNKPDEPACPVN